MSEVAEAGDGNAPEGVAITARVRVFPGTEREAHGVVVDDFGNFVGVAVEIGGHQIAPAARRWAVMLDDDDLVFVDSDKLVAE
ncbi:hypothetical protein TUM20985_53290 [Mycobacterium antarcticum]|uniref:hypothetical protein n=1 Tax=unclassified Mycolicibacterium TaxID=2636767 RepID=UPI00239CF1FD|nr:MULTISPECIES: hypothetical protein [unclassified Mycolicibacterium]BDX34782.1 hypothetical protein TUM20985_53290 [Mycolicibacterium sp. TUM20985]GLP81614.1 hypothetical protein TUM20984_30340 [Mycolicibacterium sp. TUM20984]